MVDTLALHDHMHLLRPIFADPLVLKVGVDLCCFLDHLQLSLLLDRPQLSRFIAYRIRTYIYIYIFL